MTRHPAKNKTNQIGGLATQLITAGRDSERYDGAVNPPPQRASTILYPSLAHLMGELPQKFTYGRHDTAPSNYLRDVLSKLEHGHDTMLASSGLLAITSVFLSVMHLKKNPTIFMTDNAYEPVKNFLRQILVPMGVAVVYFDPTDIKTLEQKIADHEKNLVLIWLENPGSQTFEVSDVKTIAALAKAKNILVGVDSTWAAGVYTNPLTLGANFVMHSLTKYICGHSDSLMGAVVADTAENYGLLDRGRRALGLSVGADDSYIMLRGLRTLTTRLNQHEDSTLWILEKLQSVKEVQEILHPSIPSCPGHEFWKRDYSGAGCLFSIIVDPLSKKHLASFLDEMKLFKMGFSWGAYESLILPQFPIRELAPWTKTGKVGDGDKPTLLRIQIGLEDKEDLWADLQRAFQRGYDKN